MSPAAVGLALVALAGGCAAGLPRPPSPNRALTMMAAQGNVQPADVIIVHGCPARDDGSPSTCNMRRTRAAVNAWRRGLAPRVLFTGGAVANQWSESRVMAEFAQRLGMPADVMYVEAESHHTVTNLSVGKGIMRANGWRTAIQVSEAMHLVWAKQLARFYGMRTQLLPSDMEPPYVDWVSGQPTDEFEPWRAQTLAYGAPPPARERN